jgi:4-aminobutyrate aminotransferase
MVIELNKLSSNHVTPVAPKKILQKGLEFIERDQQVLSPSYTRDYPFVMERGEGSRVWDVDGNEYLDFCAGIAVLNTGHCHPEVVKAVQEQATRFFHMAGPDFHLPAMTRLGEQLAAIAPIKPRSGHNKVFFTNSGAESVEAALKLARYHTKRQTVISFAGSFHGRTYGALSLTASKAVQRRGFGPALPGSFQIPYANCRRCVYNLSHPECNVYCLRDTLEERLFKQQFTPDEVAAIFVEAVQGEGGYIVPPSDFLPTLREICDKYGILLVVDEVQTGFGRTGKMFAVEHSGVKPDIICMAKGIASGVPMGAIVADSAVMDWSPNAHSNTYGGNALATAAALATIRLLRYGGLVENAAEVGAKMLERMQTWIGKYSIVGAARGLGLMLGVEIVNPAKPSSHQSVAEYNGAVRDTIIQTAFMNGLLLLGAGSSVVRICPPLVLTEAEAMRGLDILEAVIAEQQLQYDQQQASLN